METPSCPVCRLTACTIHSSLVCGVSRGCRVHSDGCGEDAVDDSSVVLGAEKHHGRQSTCGTEQLQMVCEQ